MGIEGSGSGSAYPYPGLGAYEALSFPLPSSISLVNQGLILLAGHVSILGYKRSGLMVVIVKGIQPAEDWQVSHRCL